MTILTLQLLGAPIVKLDDTAVTLGHTKAVAMLAYLAVTRRAHTRDALAGLLWPEFEQQRARGEVRRMLWALQKKLGKQWFQTDRQTIGLVRQADIQVDMTDIQQRLDIRQKHGHQADGLCQDCVEPLAQAVNLYTADFLEGFFLPDSEPFEQWQTKEARQLGQAVIQTVDRLLRWHLTQSAPDASYLTPLALKRLTLDPTHEPTHRLLMALYALDQQTGTALAQYRHCVDVLRQELDISPAAETVQLGERIQQDDAEFSPADLHAAFGLTTRTAAPPATPHNLPTPIIPFIGRVREQTDLLGLLKDPDVRLVSIVAPGGMGKTRLALKVGRQALAQFADGVYLVELAPLADSGGIAPTIASVVGYNFKDDGRSQIQQLLDYLATKKILLLLDNFEHLLDGIGIIADLLRQAPRLKILVTSRQRLNQSGETVFNLRGMALPSWESGADIFHYDAVQLFRLSARRLQPDFNLTGDNMATVIQICHLVQGMPLGILLAASWISVLSPAEIRAEIQHSLDILQANESDLPERQRSIRAIFDHSWEMLTEGGQQVFMKLAIFRGSFTLDAGRATADFTLPQLQSLIGKGLVTKNPNSGRYQIHELLRQYLAEKLDTHPQEKTQAESRHAAYFADFVESREDETKWPEMQAAVNDLTAALLWAACYQEGAIVERIAKHLYDFYAGRGLYETALGIFEEASELIAGDEPADEAVQRAMVKLLGVIGACQERLHRNDAARAALEQSLLLARRLDDPAQIAFSLHELSKIALNVGDGVAARKLAEEALAILRRQNREQAIFSLYFLGNIALETGHLAEAERWYSEGLSSAKAHGHANTLSIAIPLNGLGVVAWRRGEPQTAQNYIEESLEIARTIGHRWSAAECLKDLGRIAADRGDYERAQTLLAESLDIYAAIGKHVNAAYAVRHQGWLAECQGDDRRAARFYEQSFSVFEVEGGELALLFPLVDWGRMAVRLGDYEAAQSRLDMALAAFERVEHSGGIVATQTGLGMLAGAQGRLAEGIALLRESLRRAQDCQEVYESAQTAVELADLLARQGNFAAAWPLLDWAGAHPATPFHFRQRVRDLRQMEK